MRPQDLARLLHHSAAMIFGDVRAAPAMTALFAAIGGRIDDLNRGTLFNLQKDRNES